MIEETLPLDPGKQLKQKTKELKILEKEMKGNRKKRSGAVINDDITRVVDEKSVLEEQITKDVVPESSPLDIR